MTPPLSADSRFALFRAQMPISGNWAYFDHAAVSPLPAPAATAVADWARSMAEQGESTWPVGKARVEQLRGMAARLIGANLDEIALVRSTTEGINLVAEGFPWQPGDNVSNAGRRVSQPIYILG